MASIGKSVKAAADALFADPLNPALQKAFETAVLDQHRDDVRSGVVDPIGATYPRTNRRGFSKSFIILALAFGVRQFGIDKIAWTRLSARAFLADKGEIPPWVGPSTAPAVVAGRASTVDLWRKAKVDRNTGYVQRSDSAVGIPILSSPIHNPAVVGGIVTHPKNPAIVVPIDADGFPEFKPIAEVMMPYDRFGQTDAAQFKFCNEEIVRMLKKCPDFRNNIPPDVVDFYEGRTSYASINEAGLVWHHHQDGGRMQLLRVDEHEAVVIGSVQHVGGATIWGADHRNTPRDAKTNAKRKHAYKTLFTTTERARVRMP